MHPKYQQVIKLRMSGLGYTKIAKITGVSKDSVSRWCKNLKLPPKVKRIIEERIKYTHQKFSAYNELRHQVVQAENEKIRENAAKQISSLSERELLLIGAALYWAEGYKKQEKYSNPCLSFSNSDPEMIRLFLRFLREIIKVPEEKIRGDIRIYKNISEKGAINFWTKITNIPEKQFRISHQISKSSQSKRPKNFLPYGTLKLTVNSRRNFYQVRGWIDGLIKAAR